MHSLVFISGKLKLLRELEDFENMNMLDTRNIINSCVATTD